MLSIAVLHCRAWTLRVLVLGGSFTAGRSSLDNLMFLNPLLLWQMLLGSS